MHGPVPVLPEGMTIFTECPNEAVGVPRVRITYEVDDQSYAYVAYQSSSEMQAEPYFVQGHVTLREVLGIMAEMVGGLHPELLDLHRDVCVWMSDGP